jgi:hypothetical protein
LDWLDEPLPSKPRSLSSPTLSGLPLIDSPWPSTVGAPMSALSFLLVVIDRPVRLRHRRLCGWRRGRPLRIVARSRATGATGQQGQDANSGKES